MDNIAQILTKTQVTVVGLYRITAHSLARYPGPLLASLTDWYNVYHCLSGDRHLTFYDLHQTYGMSSTNGLLIELSLLAVTSTNEN